jgi:hypothetical protein
MRRSETPAIRRPGMAAQIVEKLRNDAAESHLGFPERLFAWINGVSPALIDRGLSGKLATIKQHSPSS